MQEFDHLTMQVCNIQHDRMKVVGASKSLRLFSLFPAGKHVFAVLVEIKQHILQLFLSVFSTFPPNTVTSTCYMCESAFSQRTSAPLDLSSHDGNLLIN